MPNHRSYSCIQTNKNTQKKTTGGPGCFLEALQKLTEAHQRNNVSLIHLFG